MTNQTTQEKMDSYVGKIYEKDFTRKDLEKAFPQYDIFISNKNALAIANFRPDRMRVWLDDDNSVMKVVTG